MPEKKISDYHLFLAKIKRAIPRWGSLEYKVRREGSVHGFSPLRWLDSLNLEFEMKFSQNTLVYTSIHSFNKNLLNQALL